MQTQLRLLCALAFLFGALTTLTACSGAGTSPDTGSFVFKVDPGVDRKDDTLIREVAAEARKYYERQLGYRLQNEVVINLVLSDSLSKPAFASKEATFYLTNPAWLDMDELGKRYLVAHELFHAFQYDMGGPKAFVVELAHRG